MKATIRLLEIMEKQNHERLVHKQPLLSIRDLARMSGVATSSINSLRAKRAKQIGFVTIAKLCKALGCTPGELIVLEEDRKEVE